MSDVAPGGLDHSEEPRPVIIVRKQRRKRRHGAGAWKVALADFVTAMMALFMVLWLWQSDEETQRAVAVYFQHPRSANELAPEGEAEYRTLAQLESSIKESIRSIPELEALADYVSLSETAEGLRIELLENEAGTFFQTGSPSPTGPGAETLSVIAQELGELPNDLVIEGHTDSRPFRGRNNYSNWDLSTDRANSARRILLSGGVPGDKIVQLRGFADEQLRRPEAPEDASNRRVSIIILDR